ncbi:MAG: DUF4112 domain-containing protein [Acidobacteria bacterium]|nr:DUF4112 domain-containing protein [Acidobacteriota bacterium]
MARPRVIRLRPLTPAQAQRLEALRALSQLLDSAFLLPGTRYRIGLDPIVGLVPVIGDLVSPLFAMAVLWQARELGVPRVVQLRMVFNVAIDALLGIVPVVGDLFDFAWKANDMNVALLERHAEEEHPASAGDWAFVTVMILLLLVVAVVPFVIAGAVVAAIGRLLS